jgi:hypothetical protein
MAAPKADPWAGAPIRSKLAGIQITQSVTEIPAHTNIREFEHLVGTGTNLIEYRLEGDSTLWRLESKLDRIPHHILYATPPEKPMARSN